MNAQDQAFGRLLVERHLVPTERLQGLVRAPEGGSLPERVVRAQLVDPNTVRSLIQELQRSSYGCGRCGGRYTFEQLARAPSFACPRCQVPLQRRAPEAALAHSGERLAQSGVLAHSGVLEQSGVRGPGPGLGGSGVQQAPSASGQRSKHHPNLPANLVNARRIGPYTIARELGRGTGGVVYLAQRDDGTQVAIKVLLPKNMRDPETVARFHREAGAAAKINHRGVVRTLDFGRHGDLPWFAQEFCPGRSLEQRLAAGPVTPQDAAKWLAELARTLQAAHDCNILHRDVKPANILMDEGTGRPRLADFGLSKDHDQEALTAAGTVLGTPAYMAPEQVRGDPQLDGRIDVHALGVILYECLTQARPYNGRTALEVATKILRTPLRPPSAVAANVPPALEAICLTALAKEREERYASARAMADDLDAFARGEAPSVAPVASAPQAGAGGAGASGGGAKPVRAPRARTTRGRRAPILPEGEKPPLSLAKVALFAFGATLVGVILAVLLLGAGEDPETGRAEDAAAQAEPALAQAADPVRAPANDRPWEVPDKTPPSRTPPDRDPPRGDSDVVSRPAERLPDLGSDWDSFDDPEAGLGDLPETGPYIPPALETDDDGAGEAVRWARTVDGVLFKQQRGPSVEQLRREGEALLRAEPRSADLLYWMGWLDASVRGGEESARRRFLAWANLGARLEVEHVYWVARYLFGIGYHRAGLDMLAKAQALGLEQTPYWTSFLMQLQVRATPPRRDLAQAEALARALLQTKTARDAQEYPQSSLLHMVVGMCQLGRGEIAASRTSMARAREVGGAQVPGEVVYLQQLLQQLPDDAGPQEPSWPLILVVPLNEHLRYLSQFETMAATQGPQRAIDSLRGSANNLAASLPEHAARALFVASEIAYRGGDLSQSVRLLEQALELPLPKSAQRALLERRLAEQVLDDDPQRAADLCATVTRDYPDVLFLGEQLDAMVTWARALIQLGETERAREILDEVAGRDPLDPRGLERARAELRAH